MGRRNHVLIILGMHRSGTSLVAQWLHACGLHLGDRLIGSSVGNEYGHFEDVEFHDLHEEIFRANRIPYGGFNGISRLKVNACQRAKIEGLIERKNRSRTTWGVKEPRICLFADVYEDLIDRPTFLVVHREANEVVNSLLKRREIMLSRGYYRRRIMERLRFLIIRKGILVFSTKTLEREYTEAWMYYNRRILDLIQGIDAERFRVLSYRLLLQTSQRVVLWLNMQGFELECVPFEDVFDPAMISSDFSENRIGSDLADHVSEIEHQLLRLE